MPLEKPLVTLVPSDKLTNRVLLNPKEPLTKILSSSAVKTLNDEVSKVYKNGFFSS